MASANFSNLGQESAGSSQVIVKALLAKSTEANSRIIYTLLFLGLEENAAFKFSYGCLGGTIGAKLVDQVAEESILGVGCDVGDSVVGQANHVGE